MQTDLIFKGNFSTFKGRQYFTDFYSVSLGLENSNISLIARKTDDLGTYPCSVKNVKASSWQ
jgi:hypothetical protein